MATSTMAVAVAVKPVPSVAVAVTLHVFAELGAVNTPELVIDPHEADQVTGWLAVNVCVFKACRFTVGGVTVTEVFTVTLVLAVRALPSVAVATTVHEPGVGAAVYAPLLAIDPQVAVQVEATLAVNGTTPVTETMGFSGEMVIAVAPTPESATVCGLLVPESVKLRVAVREPSALDLQHIAPEELNQVDGSVMVKDETICIRCGLCAERCPAHTITMEGFEAFDYEPVASG